MLLYESLSSGRGKGRKPACVRACVHAQRIRTRETRDRDTCIPLRDVIYQNGTRCVNTRAMLVARKSARGAKRERERERE
jgi:hypothetical protein